MADPITGAATVTPSQIEDAVFQRIGAPQDSLESWRYNEPAAEGATAYPKSRRKMRMEAEFQQYQANQIKMDSALQAMELAREAEARQQRDQIFQFEEAKTKSEREGRVQDEAGLMIDAMRGAVDNEGNVIANPIRPEDPNAIERLNGLAKEFKYGVENKAAAGMFTQLYNDALKFREERMKDSEENERLASSLSIQTGKPFEEFGTYDEQGMFQPKMQGMIAGEQEVKAGEEESAAQKEIAKETRVAEARETVAEKRSKERQIVDIEKDLRKEGLALEEVSASLGLQRDQSGRFNIGGLSDTQKKTFRAAENRVRLLEQDKAQLQGFLFDTEADAQAAIKAKTVPKGAIIFINGKKAINR
jgi:hypothetical protein